MTLQLGTLEQIKAVSLLGPKHLGKWPRRLGIASKPQELTAFPKIAGENVRTGHMVIWLDVSCIAVP